MFFRVVLIVNSVERPGSQRAIVLQLTRIEIRSQEQFYGSSESLSDLTALLGDNKNSTLVENYLLHDSAFQAMLTPMGGLGPSDTLSSRSPVQRPVWVCSAATTLELVREEQEGVVIIG